MHCYNKRTAAFQSLKWRWIDAYSSKLVMIDNSVASIDAEAWVFLISKKKITLL
jgi:hypothetical protein